MLNFKSNIILAPMAGYTDSAFRKLCTEFGAGLTTTEMVSAKGLLYNNVNTKMLLLQTGDKPSAVQIFGNDPDIMADVVASERLQNFDVIDINMGCPVPKIVKNGEGSALLLNMKLAENIIKKCVQNSRKPISVKYRIGFYKNQDICVEFGKMCEGAGASFVTIHGRTREDYYSGQAKFESIFKTAEQIKIPVFANGDIKDIKDYNYIMNNSNVYGVAIGRGALGNPQIFNSLQNIKPLDKKEIILKHLSYLKAYFDEYYVYTNFRKHLIYYINGTKNACATRNLIFTSKTIDEAVEHALYAINNG